MEPRGGSGQQHSAAWAPQPARPAQEECAYLSRRRGPVTAPGSHLLGRDQSVVEAEDSASLSLGLPRWQQRPALRLF